MNIGIIGPGRIGGNIARLLALADHNIMLSYSRNMENLSKLVNQIGERATVGSP